MIAPRYQIFNTQEAAEALGLDPSRIRQLCKSHNIGRKNGRDWLITAKELRFLQKPENRKKVSV